MRGLVLVLLAACGAPAPRPGPAAPSLPALVDGDVELSLSPAAWTLAGGAYLGESHLFAGGARLTGLVIPALCRDDGAAYHRFDRLPRAPWTVEVEHVNESCPRMTLAFLVATSRAGKKRYFGVGPLDATGRAGGVSRITPFDLTFRPDERVGLVFGANGSGVGDCGGETVIRRITVRGTVTSE